jgi:hypothetical protein
MIFRSIRQSSARFYVIKTKINTSWISVSKWQPLRVKRSVYPTGRSDTRFVQFQEVVTEEYLELEPIGLLFLVGFGTILIIQFIGMLFHRFSTLSHMLATTQITWCQRATQVRTVNNISQYQCAPEGWFITGGSFIGVFFHKQSDNKLLTETSTFM